MSEEPDNLDHITLDATCTTASRDGWNMQEALQIDGAECWAVANGCNGIFDDTIRPTRAEAQRLLETRYATFGCSVVPLRAYVDFKDNWLHRDLAESDRERHSA